MTQAKPKSEQMEIAAAARLAERALQRALSAARPLLVARLAECFKQEIAGGRLRPSSSGWIRIRSLAGLRKIAGGRFQNLRAMWLEAGLPLAGSKTAVVESQGRLDQEGWQRLGQWLHSRGFELRRPTGSAIRVGLLFEIRRRSD